MDKLEAMRAFVRIVDAGSISGAAGRLSLAKSAVSRRLAELEDHLGVQLLTRTTRRLALTDRGSEFYDRCVQILSDVEDAVAAVATADTGLKGRLRIAAPLSFGLRHLGPAINAFIDTHPELTFELDFNDRQIDLILEGFDLAVRIAIHFAVRRHDAFATEHFVPDCAFGSGDDRFFRFDPDRV